MPWFLHPSLAIVGAALVGVPILIHILMRRRRKPVAWGAMRFVIEAYKRQQRRLRFEQWLLLAARCLIVLLIGAALARPMLGAAGTIGPRGPRTVYLLVDNSLTASAVSGATSELELHKARAREVLATLDASRGDQAAIIALGAPAEHVIVPPTQDLGAVRVALDGLAATDSAADIAGGFDTVRASLAQQGKDTGTAGVSVVTLSTWRAGSFETRRSTAPASAPRVQSLVSVPANDSVDNITVVSAVPLRGVIVGARDARAASEAVRVSLRRSGPSVGREVTVRLRLAFAARNAMGPALIIPATFGAGQQSCEVSASVDVPPLADDAFGLTLVARIERGDSAQANAIAGDDVYRHPVPARGRLRVGLIASAGKAARTAADFDPADWLTLALAPAGVDEPTADIRLTRLDPRALVISDVLAQDALLVPRPDLLDDAAWAMCKKATDAGALVLITPPAAPGAQLWTDTMAAGLGTTWKVSRDIRALTSPLGVLPLEPGRTQQASVLAMLAGEFADLAKPVTVARLLDVQADDADVVLRLSDRSPLLILSRAAGADGQASRGVVALLCVAPELSWTTLPAMPLMVPLVQELVRQGVGQAAGRSSTVAGAPLEAVPGAVELVRLDEAAGGSDADAPRERLSPGGTPRFASLYRAMDANGLTRSLVAVNPDALAGRTEAQGRADVQTALAALGIDATWFGEGPATPGQPTAPTLAAAMGSINDAPSASWHVPALFLALLLVICELALARLASHARVLKPSAASLGPATAVSAPVGDAA